MAKFRDRRVGQEVQREVNDILSKKEFVTLVFKVLQLPM